MNKLFPITKKYGLLFGLIFSSLFLSSCDDWNNVPNFDVQQIEGYRPVYANDQEMQVTTTAARPIQDAGKIYVIEEYLLVVEPLVGIHLFNNSDPKNPAAIGFLQIAGSNDVAIRDNILYADRGSDLLAIDIGNLNAIRVVSAIKNVFPFAQQYPQVSGTYYECPDPAKGVVVAWEKVTLTQPKCYH
ncbi:MAG: hypothetical protein ACI9C9_001278 [Marivirga sp.]|jgi:hypothetical protein